MGGTLTELDNLDVSKKTIILMSELHQDKTNRLEYNIIIQKQKNIINLALEKFGEDKTYFYSEAPEEYKRLVLNTDNYSSSVIVQFAQTKMPIKLSSITACDRNEGSCDDKYSDDILSIFYENPEINCIAVAIGLLHIPELKRILSDKQPDMQIIIVNTVSNVQLSPLISDIRRRYPSIIELLGIEPPYNIQYDPPSLSGKRKEIDDPPPVVRNDLERGQLTEHLPQAQERENQEREREYQEREREQRILKQLERNRARQNQQAPQENRGTFTPVVEFNKNGDKIFRCPVCNRVSGTAAPLRPQDLSLTPHAFNCVNTGKFPIER